MRRCTKKLKKKNKERRTENGEKNLTFLSVFSLVSGGVVTGYIGMDNPAKNRIELAVSLLKEADQKMHENKKSSR